MRNPLARAAFVFVCALLVAPSVVEGACYFSLVEPAEDGRQGAETPLKENDPICVRAMALKSRFAVMKQGADAWAKKVERKSRSDGKGALRLKFMPSTIRLSNLIDNVKFPNAYYAYYPQSSNPGFIQVNKGFVMKEDGEDGAASFGLSHELSHGIQHALGVQGKRCHRGHEAQADLWGGGVLVSAGMGGDRTEDQIAEFFQKKRILSDKATARAAEGCAAHPPGRTRFVNAAKAVALKDRNIDLRGSKTGIALMKMPRETLLEKAGVVFDGDKDSERSDNSVRTAGMVTPWKGFGKDGVFRASDFTPQGSLIIREDIGLPLNVKMEDVTLDHINLAQSVRLGNAADWWKVPFLEKIAANGVNGEKKGLINRMLSGISAMSPTKVAKQETLRMIIALQDSLGAGPVFAFFRQATDKLRLA